MSADGRRCLLMAAGGSFWLFVVADGCLEACVWGFGGFRVWVFGFAGWGVFCWVSMFWELGLLGVWCCSMLFFGFTFNVFGFVRVSVVWVFGMFGYFVFCKARKVSCAKLSLATLKQAGLR